MNGTNLRKKYLTVKSKGTNMKSIIIAGCALVLLSGCASANKDQLYYDAAKSISKDNTMTQTACWAAISEIAKGGDNGAKIGALALADRCKNDPVHIQAPKRNVWNILGL
jgi:uncharacterized lipoprotein YajG